MNIFKKFIVFGLFLLVFACTSEFSYEEKPLLDFVLKSENSGESSPILTTENPEKTWGESHFPDRCEWFDFERVVDGDTIIVLSGETQIRVRMIGIDTPESKKPGVKIQPFALEATEKLKEFLFEAKKVCLIGDEVGDKYDHYGRKLAYAFTEKGMDLNLEMLKTGLAKGYFNFPFERKEEFKLANSGQ